MVSAVENRKLRRKLYFPIKTHFRASCHVFAQTGRNLWGRRVQQITNPLLKVFFSIYIPHTRKKVFTSARKCSKFT
jgi:hypothetical protein